MSTVNPETQALAETEAEQENNTFAELLSSFERQHSGTERSESVTGTIVSVTADTILIDIGRKTEGSLSLAAWREARQEEEPQRGSTIPVSVGPRDAEGYYQLSTMKVVRPKDWSGLQAAFAEKRTIAGTVVEQVKGGFRVDIGVRAFMPASRSGVRDAEELPKLVGQEIQCRITKLDVENEDVVVDHRVIVEEEQTRKRQAVFATLSEGAIVTGRVRSVMDFGAFLDLGGIDGLLHIMDISWSRLGKAGDAVKVDDVLQVKILKVDPASHKISLGLKQLQEEPWTIAARTFEQGQRVSGTVSRLTDFGAFVELLPGVDGLIHLSEMSWDKRVRKPGDLVKPGDRVETVVLQINMAERRISLGLKQTLGDPWENLPTKFPVGSQVEGPITNLANFGAFVDLGDGIEGMIHISDITNEKRLDHPKDFLAKGQTVKAVVLELDREKRRIRLGMKQLEPTSVDHYIAEHHAGDTVSGRLVEVHGTKAKVELGEGVIAQCQIKRAELQREDKAAARASDVGALSAMLSARWKQGAGESTPSKDVPRAGQVCRFRIAHIDPSKRLIELELAS
jgi:small subunit ribosomal protein S1